MPCENELKLENGMFSCSKIMIVHKDYPCTVRDKCYIEKKK